MAHTIETTPPQTRFAFRVFGRLRDAIARRMTYNLVLKELSAMSDRELTDINLCRGDIRRVAREAMDL